MFPMKYYNSSRTNISDKCRGTNSVEMYAHIHSCNTIERYNPVIFVQQLIKYINLFNNINTELTYERYVQIVIFHKCEL